MPSLPTSLIVVGLVAAWLVVLVPMVAKRREHVPDSDDDSAGFRVLRRASRSLRRSRPVMSRTAVSDGMADRADRFDSDEIDDSDRDDGDDAADIDDEDRYDGGDEAFGAGARDEWDEYDGGDEVAAFSEGSAEFDDRDELADRNEVASRGDGSDVAGSASAATRQDMGERVLWPRSDRPGRRPSARPRRAPVASYRQPEYDDGGDGSPARDDRHRGDNSRDHWERGGDQLRPVPVRPGRGGFDPRAAEQAKAYRYRQRRRVAVVLLALAAVCAVAGVLGVSLAWAGAVCSFVLLALYLAYLRRQVRIEESIRLRRATRLERARQIRPVYRASVAEQVRAHRSGSLPRPGPDDEVDPAGEAPYRVTSHAHPTSSVPPTYYTRGVPVDLDDDDPAFDDLEYYRPATYRRAVGE